MTENLITYHWLKDHFYDENLIILDVSPEANKAGMRAKYPGKIKGARSFNLAKDFSDPNSELPNTMPSQDQFQRNARRLGINHDSQIVIYDNLGIYTSPRVWYMFKAMGHEQVMVLDGGLDAWVESGGEVEDKSESRRSFGDFKATYSPNYLITAAEIAEHLSSDDLMILDARSADRFYTRVAEPRAGLKGGRIPGSSNLPFQEVLKNGHFKSIPELKHIFDNINLERKETIFTCGSGLTASIILFAMSLVSDIPVRLYDGSWTEWAQSSYQIET